MHIYFPCCCTNTHAHTCTCTLNTQTHTYARTANRSQEHPSSCLRRPECADGHEHHLQGEEGDSLDRTSHQLRPGVPAPRGTLGQGTLPRGRGGGGVDRGQPILPLFL